MILTPWYEPAVFTRAWCLFELYCTIECGCAFEVAMPARCRAELLRDIEEDVELAMDKMFSKIDVKNSTAFKSIDKENILKAVKRIGYVEVNVRIFVKMRDWVKSQIEMEISKYRDDPGNMERFLRYRLILTRFRSLSKVGLSEVGDTSNTAAATLGGSQVDATTITARDDTNAEIRETRLQEFAEFQRNLGESHILTLQYMRFLGNYQDDIDRKIEWQQQCVDKCIAELDNANGSHIETILAKAALVRLRLQRKQDDVPVRLVEIANDSLVEIANECVQELSLVEIANDSLVEIANECVQELSRKVGYGASHPITLQCKYELARCYEYENNYERAITICKEVYSSQEGLLGNNNPQTIISAVRLSYLYRTEWRYSEAEALITWDMVDKGKVLLSIDHQGIPDMRAEIHRITLESMNFMKMVPLLWERWREEKSFAAGFGLVFWIISLKVPYVRPCNCDIPLFNIISLYFIVLNILNLSRVRTEEAGLDDDDGKYRVARSIVAIFVWVSMILTLTFWLSPSWPSLRLFLLKNGIGSRKNYYLDSFRLVMFFFLLYIIFAILLTTV